MTSPTARLDHIAIVARSLEASLLYYQALLPLAGFERRGERAWANAGGLTLHLLEAAPGSRAYDRMGPGVNHIGFAVGSVEEVEAVRSGMAPLGFEVPGVQLISGSVALFMKDPDGFRIEISCEE